MMRLTRASHEDSNTERSRRRRVFVVTALGVFMASLDLSIVNVAFPALQHTFSHDSRASLTWIITGYSIVFGSLLVVAGRTADRRGSRTIFLAGLAVFSVGSLACALSPTVPLLIASRVVQAVGAASLLPASLSLLLAAYPKEQRSHIVALWGGIGALAVATGPSVGAALISALGWRAAFYVNLPVGLFAWLAGRRTLSSNELVRDHARPDYVGAVLLSASMGSLVLAVSQGPAWGWTRAWTLTAFVVALVLGAIFLRRSQRHASPVLDLTLFSSRSFRAANAAVVLYAMGFFAVLLGNMLFLTGVWHYSILRAGLAITPSPVIVALTAGPAGRTAARVGFRPVLLTGFGIFTLGLAWFATQAGSSPSYLGVWLPGSILVGLGIGLTFPVLSAAAVSSLHPERFAVGSAVNQTARQIGGSLGVAILVVVLGTPRSAQDAVNGFHELWWFVAVTAVAAGAVSSLLSPHRARPLRDATLVARSDDAAPFALNIALDTE